MTRQKEGDGQMLTGLTKGKEGVGEMLKLADKVGGGSGPQFLADIICEQPTKVNILL